MPMERPFLMRGFFYDNNHRWSINSLVESIGDRSMLLKCRVSKKTCGKTMETDCTHLMISLHNFQDWLNGHAVQPNPLKNFSRSKYFCYIDYKYMKDMFQDFPQLLNDIQWSSVGLESFDGHDSTMWIGSEGANTPCHQDSYGFNLVRQIEGRKLWVLFPPEDTGCLYPTRIPYEESSIFSDVNVRKPDVNIHPLIKGTHPVIVTLHPGDTLYVPQHWWHFVESLDPSISVNVWIPAEGDNKSRYHEAVTRAVASSLIKDLSSSYAAPVQRLLNPTETLEDASFNMTILRTALTNYLQDVEITSKGASFSPEASAVIDPVCEVEGESQVFPNYLNQFATAVERYPVKSACSPFESKDVKKLCLKRKSDDIASVSHGKQQKCLDNSNHFQKKQHECLKSADCIALATEADGEEPSNDSLSSTKHLLSLECCSVDTYIDYMNHLCHITKCTSCSAFTSAPQAVPASNKDQDNEPDFSIKDLSAEEIAETLVSSLLHPDVIQAVGDRFIQQCKVLIQQKRRDGVLEKTCK